MPELTVREHMRSISPLGGKATKRKVKNGQLPADYFSKISKDGWKRRRKAKKPSKS